MDERSRTYGSISSTGMSADGAAPRAVDPEISRRMRRIQAKNTSPEVTTRRILHSSGFRFRLHRRDLPGTPDIVLPRLRVAVFVNGCFWHQHSGCRLARPPKANPGYWVPKFQRIAARDRTAADRLESLGWHVLVVWECETRRPDQLSARLSRCLYALSKERSRKDRGQQ